MKKRLHPTPSWIPRLRVIGEPSAILTSLLLPLPPAQEPGSGFEELLPCPHEVISLFNATIPENPYQILNATVSTALGLPPLRGAASSDPGEQIPATGEGEHGTEGLKEDPSRMRDGVRRRLRRAREPRDGEAGSGRELVGMGFGDGERLSGSGIGRGAGLFDLSVLCTAVSDVNHLMKSTYPVDPRLVDALLWDVQVSGSILGAGSATTSAEGGQQSWLCCATH